MYAEDAYDANNMKAETVQQAASRLMADGKVLARVRELQDAAAKKTIMTSADVLREAMRLARFDIRKLYRADGSPSMSLMMGLCQPSRLLIFMMSTRVLELNVSMDDCFCAREVAAYHQTGLVLKNL